MKEINEILQKHGLTDKKTIELYADLSTLWLKTKDQKTKNIAQVLSSAIFEFKKYYIENK
jgi:hypothetical protein